MKRLVESVVYGFGLLLLAAVGFKVFFEGWVEDPAGFWIVTLVFIAILLAVALASAYEAASRKSAPPALALATLAIFIFALLRGSPVWGGLPVGGQGALLAVAIGAPLGIGASKALTGQFHAVHFGDVAVGFVAGVAGVVLAMALFLSLQQQFGWRPSVPLADVWTFNPLGLHLAPPAVHQLDELECTAGVAKCPPNTGWQSFLAFVAQAAQSSLASLWDALLFGAVAFALTAAARSLFRMKR